MYRLSKKYSDLIPLRIKFLIIMIMYTPAGYCILHLSEKVCSTMEESIVRKAFTGEEEKAGYILGKPAKPAMFHCCKPELL